MAHPHPCGDATNQARILVTFTGKERDGGPALDYFGARYMPAAQGRFTIADPLRWAEWQRGDERQKQMFAGFIADPQNFNQYTYVRNNPLSSTDPSGLYTCSGAEDQCKNREAQLVEARKSNDSKVNRGAAAYGAFGENNGVRVSFSDKQAAGHGNTGLIQVVDAQTDKSSTEIGVEFSAAQFSGANAGTSVTAGAVVVDEGSHVADDQAYLVGAAVLPGIPNAADITHFQSEAGAYLTGAAFIAEHGRVQSTPIIRGAALNNPGIIAVFPRLAPSGRPPYRAYSDSVLRPPISR